jgi:low affinity Fe/Cu permease
VKALARAWGRVATWAAHPIAPIVSAVLTALLWALAGVDSANFAISVLSLILLFVLTSQGAADTLSLHVKMDEILRALPEADNRFRHIDERTADEIRELRE